MVKWSRVWGHLRSWVTYVLLYPIKKRRMYRFFSSQGLSDFDLVFDIGAHLGDKTRFFADHGCQVVSLEPQPFYISKLQQRFANHARVTILPQAVSDQTGQHEMQLSDRYPTISSLDKKLLSRIGPNLGWPNKWDDHIVVTTTTLDHLIDQYGPPDFVKIDVEGHESQVLGGLSTPLPFLSFELLPVYPDAALQSIAVLEQLAPYHYAFSPGETFQFSTDWQAAESIRSWIETYRQNQTRPGDIYARLASSST